MSDNRERLEALSAALVGLKESIEQLQQGVAKVNAGIAELDLQRNIEPNPRLRVREITLHGTTYVVHVTSTTEFALAQYPGGRVLTPMYSIHETHRVEEDSEKFSGESTVLVTRPHPEAPFVRVAPFRGGKK